MFENCTSLTAGPYLPSPAVPPSGYRWLFYGCTKLQAISCNFTSWNTTNTNAWVNGITNNTGTFYKPAALATTRGVNNIPNNWSIVDIS